MISYTNDAYIAIFNNFNSLSKSSDINDSYQIYNHIKNFISHYKVVDIQNYTLDFQNRVFLATFSGSARALLQPFFETSHEKIFCHQICLKP